MPSYDLSKIGIDELLNKHKGENAVHVFGYGLEAHQQRQLQGQSVYFHPSQAPAGFSSIRYNSELVQGEPMLLEGSIQRNDSGTIRILLTGFGQVLDSAKLDGHNAFSISYLPANVGVASYGLIALKGKDTLDQQRLPLVVSEQEPLKIIFLGSAPGFEARFFKDWLSAKGYQVISRTSVSKNVYDKQFVNEERKSVDRITPSLLRDADCIVADNSALAGLSSPEIVAITKAVAEDGLGLLINHDGGESIPALPISYRVNRLPGSMLQKLDLQTETGRTLKTLNTEEQFEIEKGRSLRQLIQDKGGRAVAVMAMHGSGRIVLNTINYSYKWMLSGAGADYDLFWWTLMRKAIGSRTEETWTLLPQFPSVGHPLTLRVETSAVAPVGIIGDQKIYLRGDARLPTIWEGSFWPDTTGWLQLGTTDSVKKWFYVFEDKAWRPLKMARRIRETREFVALSGSKTDVLFDQERTEKRQLPSILFLLLFMGGAGFLWYEQKRMSG
jgi:hypothetical protein